MRLHWFGPTAPNGEGSTRLARRTIAALCERADVTLWTSGTDLERVAHSMGARPTLRVANQDDPTLWKELNTGGLPVFHLADSPAHVPAWTILEQVGGLVMLEDFSLQRLFFSRFERAKQTDRYRSLMRRESGLEGARAADLVLAGDVSPETWADRFPLLGPALDRALGILTRSPLPKELVRRAPGPCRVLPWPHRRTYPGRGSRPGSVQEPLRLAVVCATEATGTGAPWQDLGLAMAGIAELETPMRISFFGSRESADLAASVVRSPTRRIERTGTATGPLDGLEDADLALNLAPVELVPDIQTRLWDERLPSVVARPELLRARDRGSDGGEGFLEMARDVQLLGRQLEEISTSEPLRRELAASGVRRLEGAPDVDRFSDGLVALAADVERDRFRTGLASRGTSLRDLLLDLDDDARSWAARAFAKTMKEIGDVGTARPVQPPRPAEGSPDHDSASTPRAES